MEILHYLGYANISVVPRLYLPADEGYYKKDNFGHAIP